MHFEERTSKTTARPIRDGHLATADCICTTSKLDPLRALIRRADGWRHLTTCLTHFGAGQVMKEVTSRPTMHLHGLFSLRFFWHHEFSATWLSRCILLHRLLDLLRPIEPRETGPREALIIEKRGPARTSASAVASLPCQMGSKNASNPNFNPTWREPIVLRDPKQPIPRPTEVEGRVVQA